MMVCVIAHVLPVESCFTYTAIIEVMFSHLWMVMYVYINVQCVQTENVRRTAIITIEELDVQGTLAV